MHETIILTDLSTRSFKYGMTICYLSSPPQHKWEMEILNRSVLIRDSLFASSLQPGMGKPQGFFFGCKKTLQYVTSQTAAPQFFFLYLANSLNLQSMVIDSIALRSFQANCAKSEKQRFLLPQLAS